MLGAASCGLEEVASPEMSEARRTVPEMNEPLSCYDVIVTVARDGSFRPDPATFTGAANQAAWCRSASIISAHLADKIISVVTVTAPDRYAAAAVAQAVVSDALKHQVPGWRQVALRTWFTGAADRSPFEMSGK